MDWDAYSIEFSTLAIQRGFDERYVERCLAYAKRLADSGLPIIFSLDHLSHLVGFDAAFVLQVAYRQAGFYRNFMIEKRSGGKRQISEPLPNLKWIQRWLLWNVLNAVEPSTYAKAYVKGRSIKDNGKFHRKQPIVLKLDVADYFPSLTSNMVGGLFRSFGYSRKVSYYLTRLCTLDGALPQGAPTSAAISNLLMRDFDETVANQCLSKGFRYTRYADDLTFSGNLDPGAIIGLVQTELRKMGLRLNQKKIRVMREHERQIVTGLVTNQKLQVPRELRRKIRQSAYYIDKFGLENHSARTLGMRANFGSHLYGLAQYVLFVNPRDRDAQALVMALKA